MSSALVHRCVLFRYLKKCRHGQIVEYDITTLSNNVLKDAAEVLIRPYFSEKATERTPVIIR